MTITILLFVLAVVVWLSARQALLVWRGWHEHGSLYASWQALRDKNANEMNALLVQIHARLPAKSGLWAKPIKPRA
jgi:hypothetical protein